MALAASGSKEEFVQLMHKSLMAEQLFAEGVGPNQKIEEIDVSSAPFLLVERSPVGVTKPLVNICCLDVDVLKIAQFC